MSETLKFDRAEVANLVAHAIASEEHRATYDSEPIPSLHLVGDHGIYLMSSGIPRQEKDGEAVVAYAEGTDPNKDEDFYENKRAMYGGDDGVDAIPLKEIVNVIARFDGPVIIKLSETSIIIG